MTLFGNPPPERLRKAVEESSGIVRPNDDSGLDFLRKRYGHIRRFVPAFLAAFPFRSNVDPDPLLKAVDLLRRLSERRGPSLPRSTTVDFVPAKWRSYVIDGQGRIDRAYFELCVLSELRAALRAGDVWLESSRRYSDPETYLIPRNRWTALRGEVCQQLQVSDEGTVRLTQRAAELEAILGRVDPLLKRDTGVRMEDGDLIVTQLEAEERPESAVTLERLRPKPNNDTGGEFPLEAARPEFGQNGAPCEEETRGSRPPDEFATSINNRDTSRKVATPHFANGRKAK